MSIIASKEDKITEKQVKEWIERGVKKLEDMDCREKKGWKKHSSSGTAGAIWCLGFIGAAVYYVQQAVGFGAVIVALLKALVWPAFLVYHLMKYLGV